MPGVLLSGKRFDTRVQLNWGGDATRYSLSFSRDSSPVGAGALGYAADEHDARARTRSLLLVHGRSARRIRRSDGDVGSADARSACAARARLARQAVDALDRGAERAQPLVDALVALVDLGARCRSSTFPRRRALRAASPCRRGCRGSPSAAPTSCAGPVTTARCGSQRMIRAPIDTSLSVKNSRFSNIFSNIMHRAERLRRDRDRDRREVGRERRPRAVLDLRDHAAEVVLDQRF